MPRRAKIAPVDTDTLRDLLLLVGIDTTEEEVEGWTPQQRDEMEAWAGAHYLRASDNPTRVPPRPTWFRPPTGRNDQEGMG